MNITNQQIERRIAALRASLDHLPPAEARDAEREIIELRAELRRPTYEHPERRGVTHR